MLGAFLGVSQFTFQPPRYADAMTIPVLQMKKLRPKETEDLARYRS